MRLGLRMIFVFVNQAKKWLRIDFGFTQIVYRLFTWTIWCHFLALMTRLRWSSMIRRFFFLSNSILWSTYLHYAHGEFLKSLYPIRKRNSFLNVNKSTQSYTLVRNFSHFGGASLILLFRKTNSVYCHYIQILNRCLKKGEALISG